MEGDVDQERFDELAKKVFDGTSRRRVLGGALASAVGAGVAAVSGIAAKGTKGKGKGRSKKGKGKQAGAEFTCTAANANFESCAAVTCAVDADCSDVGCFAGCNAALDCGDDPGNTDGACPPGSCCASTPAGTNDPSCIDVITQITSGEGGFCGDLGGEGVCRRCPEGTRCSQDPFTFEIRCVCNAATCDGCCISNAGFSGDDQCIANGSGQRIASPNPDFDGEFVCGTGGGVCQDCGNAFSGCCTSTGVCAGGEAALECGSNGTICANCTTTGATCVSQTCTGGTTTTTAGPGTTTTTAVPCVAPKKACATATGTICCGRKKKCQNAGTANAKCKKKKRK
jgi:hypothetical protein